MPFSTDACPGEGRSGKRSENWEEARKCATVHVGRVTAAVPCLYFPPSPSGAFLSSFPLRLTACFLLSAGNFIANDISGQNIIRTKRSENFRTTCKEPAHSSFIFLSRLKGITISPPGYPPTRTCRTYSRVMLHPSP